MQTNQLVFDISSDEEVAFEESKVCEDEFDWLTELLETVDKKEGGCHDGDAADADDDEILVIGEYNPPKSRSNSKSVSLKPDCTSGGDADDDCVVLDGDPDKPVAVADDPVSEGGDDVLVVGQTGQVACRDFPHPRHLCVKFPFGSTPHGDHCHLCHCYVCDSLAPCAHWGTGVNLIDHCHATDELEMWRTQREIFRICKASVVPKIPGTPLPVTAPHNNRASVLDSAPRNQISRPSAIRVCSSTRQGFPNIRRRRSGQHPGYIQDRNGFLLRAVPQQPVGLRNHLIARARGSYSSDFGLRHCPYNAMFKGSATLQSSLEMNQSVYGYTDKTNFVPASKYMTSTAPHAMQNENFPGSLDVSTDTVLESYTFPTLNTNTGCAVVNQMSSGPEASSQPIPQPNSGQRIYHVGNQSRNGSDCRSTNLATYNCTNSSSQSDGQPLSTSKFYENRRTQLQNKDRDHWCRLLNQPVLVTSEELMSGDLNEFSPEPSATGGGMIYLDTETPWNNLGHA